MMTWEIVIPFRDREDSISDAMGAAHELPPEDRAVVRNALAELATECGARTAGDALDLLEQASPEARRALLDRARGEAGLPTTETADARREFEAMSATRVGSGEPFRAASGYLLSPICAAPECLATTSDRTKAKVWWCSAHRGGHEADMEDWTGPRLAFGPSGAIVDLDEQEREAAREREREKSRAAQRLAREADQRAAAAEAEEDQRAERERLDAELAPGMPRP